MAKKGIGKVVALAAIVGVAAAGISYLKKYQSFNKELDEDFHDFEEEDAPIPDSTMNRNYVSLHADKDELFVAAGDMLTAAKNVVKDAAAIMADTTREAVSAVNDSASTKSFNDTLKKAKDNTAEVMEDVTEEVMEETQEAITKVKEAVTTIVEEAEGEENSES